MEEGCDGSVEDKRVRSVVEGRAVVTVRDGPMGRFAGAARLMVLVLSSVVTRGPRRKLKSAVDGKGEFNGYSVKIVSDGPSCGGGKCPK